MMLKVKSLFILLICISCSQNKNSHNTYHHMETIKYYETFYTYNHPVKLSGELSKDEINLKDTYLITTWNGDVLLKVEKILRKKFFFSYEYFYNEKNKLEKVVITNINGDINTITY